MVRKACVKMKCYSEVFNKSMCVSMPLVNAGAKRGHVQRPSPLRIHEGSL